MKTFKNIYQIVTSLILVTIFFIPKSTIAQIDSSEVNKSPYGVIYNHLYYLQQDSYDPQKASLSFPKNIEHSQKIAIDLKRVLDGKGYYVDLHRVSNDNNYIDSTTNENVYFIEKGDTRLYLEKTDDKWFYSRTTVGFTPKMFKEVYPFGTNIVKQLSGPFWEYKILGISIGKIFGLILLIISCILLFYIIRQILKYCSRKIISTQSGLANRIANDHVIKISRIGSLFLVTRLFNYLFPMIQMPIRVNNFTLKGIGILSLFFIILILTEISNIIFDYLDTVVRKTKNTLDDQLLPVLKRVVKFIIWAIGLLYILEYLGINVTALLAGISIGGLAIALAAQDTVKNFFGSIMIFVDKPFQIGDWINFDNVNGTVEEVGIRSTRIRTFSNSVTYVPNGMLADKVINNMGLRQYRRYTTTIGIKYDTPPYKIDLFVDGIREIIKMHPFTKKDYFEVHLNGLSNSSIDILVYCFFEVDNWSKELTGRHDLIQAIIILAHDLSISFAYPSQSIYLEKFTDEIGDNHQYNISQSLNKIDKYFAKNQKT